MTATKKQRAVVAFLLRYQRENGMPPSLREMCAAFGGQLVEHRFSRIADARAWIACSDQGRPWRIQARSGGIWQTIHQSWRG